MAELSDVEANVLMVFRVTGFFGKTPKKNVSRRSDGVWRSLQANNIEMSPDDIASGISSLADKGLLRLDGGIIYLTDTGYEVICR